MNEIQTTDQADDLNELAVAEGFLVPGDVFRVEYMARGSFLDPRWPECHGRPDHIAEQVEEAGWSLFRTEQEAYTVSAGLDRRSIPNAWLPVSGHLPGPAFREAVQGRLLAAIPLVLVEQYAWLHILEEVGVYAGAWWDDTKLGGYSGPDGVLFDSVISRWSFESVPQVEIDELLDAFCTV